MANLYLFQTPKQKTLGFFTAILLLGMPLLSALTSLLSGTTPLPAGVRLAQRTFNMLWFCGFLSLTALIALLARSMQSSGSIQEILPVQVSDSGALVVQGVGQPVHYRNTISGLQGSFWGLDIDDDSLRLAWTALRISPSPDSQYHAVLIRSSRGASRPDAHQRAEAILYAAEATRQPNILNLPSGYVVPQKSYFRGQQVAVELQIPTGRAVRFDRSLQTILPDGGFLETNWDYTPKRGKWKYQRHWQELPQVDVLYKMGTDGRLHRADGKEESALPVRSTLGDSWDEEDDED